MTKKIRLNLYLEESYFNLIKEWCSSHPHRTYGEFVERCIFKALSKPDTATGIPRIPSHEPKTQEKAPSPEPTMPRPNSNRAMPRPITKEKFTNGEEEFQPPSSWKSLRKHE